mgnify:CR=1 FL=1
MSNKKAPVKKTDRDMSINDLGELVLALDKKITKLEQELQAKDGLITRIKQRMGL